MKKLLPILLATVLCLTFFASCNTTHTDNEWFSEEKLLECHIPEIPKVTNEYVNKDGENIYTNFSDDEFESYANSVYEYLKAQNFEYFGTRGEQVVTLAGVLTTYLFKPATELSEFNINGNYIFVYSDGTKDEDDTTLLYVLTINSQHEAPLEYDDKIFTYNTTITLRKRSELPLNNFYILLEDLEPDHTEHTGEWLITEQTHQYQFTCGCPSLDIAEEHLDSDSNGKCDVCGYVMDESLITEFTITMNDENWLYEPLAQSYVAGERVSVKINMAIDLGYLFLVNGEDVATCNDVDGLYWEFTFTMPSRDTVIDFKTYDGVLPHANYALLIETYYIKHLEADSVLVKDYYGEFESGAIVAMIEAGTYDDACWTEEISGVAINYNNGNRITVLYEGEFYTLTEAFENEFITLDDLTAISNMHKQFYPYMYEEQTE